MPWCGWSPKRWVQLSPKPRRFCWKWNVSIRDPLQNNHPNLENFVNSSRFGEIFHTFSSKKKSQLFLKTMPSEVGAFIDALLLSWILICFFQWIGRALRVGVGPYLQQSQRLIFCHKFFAVRLEQLHENHQIPSPNKNPPNIGKDSTLNSLTILKLTFTHNFKLIRTCKTLNISFHWVNPRCLRMLLLWLASKSTGKNTPKLVVIIRESSPATTVHGRIWG